MAVFRSCCEKVAAMPRLSARARLTLCVSMLALAGCDPGPPLEAVGLSRTVEGGIYVRYIPCYGELIEQLQLFHDTGGPVVGDKYDRLLWRIRSRSGNRSYTFRLGVAAPGFKEDVPLRRPLAPSQPLILLIDTSSVENYATFRPNQIKPGMFLVAGRSVDTRTFSRLASESCYRP